MSEVYQSSNAAKNIADVISAMSDAQKSQIDLKKAVMMKQIGDKMDLAQKQGEQNIEVQKPIQQTQAWLDYAKNQGQETQNNGVNSAGRATNATPAIVGAQPALPGQPQANPMAPTPMPSQTLTAPTQPNAGAGGQPIVPPGRTQAPMTPVLNSPSAAPGGAPIMPTSIQYNNLGYKPVSPQQLLQARQQAKQPINQADIAYGMAHKKLVNGTATQGEIDMVHKMNNMDENGNPKNPDENISKIQSALDKIAQARGMAPGSLMLGSDGNPTINPIYQSKQEALLKYQMEQPDKYGRLAEQDLMRVFSYKSGALGVQDAKIGQAMHLKQLLDQAYDPKTGIYNIKGPQFAELTQGLATLVSNSNQTSEAQRDEIKQRTIKGDINGLATYLTGSPKNATTQDIAKMYGDAIDRQALTAQYIKTKDLSEIQKLDSFNQLRRVDPERADALYKANFGVDYKEYLKMPYNERIKMITGEDPNDAGGQGGGNTPPSFDPKTQKLQQNSKTQEYRVVPL